MKTTLAVIFYLSPAAQPAKPVEILPYAMTYAACQALQTPSFENEVAAKARASGLNVSMVAVQCLKMSADDARSLKQTLGQ
jgi:hypothetical protein